MKDPNTLDLFDAPVRARRKDPGTSHAAASKVDSFAKQHYGMILVALHKLGTGTQTEIARVAGLRPDQVWRRLSEMENKVIEVVTKDGAAVTRAGESKRQQRVWKVK